MVVAPGAQCLRAAADAILLANASAVVFGYQTDAPQFNNALYLPILMVADLVVPGGTANAFGRSELHGTPRPTLALRCAGHRDDEAGRHHRSSER